MFVRIISALLLGFSSFCALAQADKPIRLAPDAPERHIVRPGDTLWGIAGKFLQDPWRWPDIWRLNRDQISNPHRIYPGQVVILDRSGGQPQLKLGQRIDRSGKLEPTIYSEPSLQPIPSIPAQIIEPFLSEPLVVEADALDASPRIVATQETRLFLGQGNIAYASGLTKAARVWQVYRPVKPIIDPVTRETLGHEAFYLGTARVVREGEPATLQILSAKQEIGVGDHLVPLVRPDLVTYAPHAPDQDVEGRVVGFYAGVNVSETGTNYIVTLNRGRKDGLEAGHVLALYRRGENLGDLLIKGDAGVQLPQERYGLVFVFRTFDRVSYALVMDSSRPVMVYDVVRNP